MELKNVYKEDGIYCDNVEKSPEYLKVIDSVKEEVAQIIKDLNLSRRMGVCHLHWHHQKRILKERHGIDWRTPPELNPDARFD